MTRILELLNIRKLCSKCYKKLNSNSYSKGFSLIELLIVITIMVILIALLVPNIMGYVRKAKKIAAISDAKTMLDGAQTALIYESRYGAFQVDKEVTINNKKIMCAGISNTAMTNAIHGGTQTNTNDTNTANAVIEMLAAMAIDPGYARSGSAYKPFGKTGRDYLNLIDSQYGMLIVYQKNGAVLFMQVYHDGILVTYANGYYVANDNKDAKFISLGQSFAKPFLDAGFKESEIAETLKKSKMPSRW
jgi:prepilin-type N-terminal cleavage/methylation domain-containing protein